VISLKQVYLTRSRVSANIPLKATGVAVSIEEMNKKFENVKGLPVKDAYQVGWGQSDSVAPSVGTILDKFITPDGHTWLIYEVDLEKLSYKARRDITTRKAGAFAAFEYSSEEGYKDVMYAIIYQREPDRYPWEAENTTHVCLTGIKDDELEMLRQVFDPQSMECIALYVTKQNQPNVAIVS